MDTRTIEDSIYFLVVVQHMPTSTGGGGKGKLSSLEKKEPVIAIGSQIRVISSHEQYYVVAPASAITVYRCTDVNFFICVGASNVFVF